MWRASARASEPARGCRRSVARRLHRYRISRLPRSQHAAAPDGLRDPDSYSNKASPQNFHRARRRSHERCGSHGVRGEGTSLPTGAALRLSARQEKSSAEVVSEPILTTDVSLGLEKAEADDN